MIVLPVIAKGFESINKESNVELVQVEVVTSALV